MTRVIAIFLITVHLINIIGSYGLIANLEHIHQKNISDRLDDNEFSGSGSITLRIPFSLPYWAYNQNYERVSGSIEFEGHFYQLVKQKLFNDTLFIVCVKDVKLTEIKQTFKELAASITDSPADGKTSTKAHIQQVKDFEECGILQLSTTWLELESLRLPFYRFSVTINSGSHPDKPPSA